VADITNMHSQTYSPKDFNILTVNKTLKRIKRIRRVPRMERKMHKGTKMSRLCTNPQEKLTKKKKYARKYREKMRECGG
jgi:hypothetical protein